MSAAADERTKLDLQIKPAAEHEVTKFAALVSAISGHLGDRRNEGRRRPGGGFGRDRGASAMSDDPVPAIVIVEEHGSFLLIRAEKPLRGR